VLGGPGPGDTLFGELAEGDAGVLFSRFDVALALERVVV